MLDPALMSVFANAALPQKIVLVALVAAVPAIFLAVVLARGPASPWRRLIGDLGVAGPALGLLVGAMNAFHMSETIRRVPFNPTAKQLGPGLAEVSVLIGLGALVGLVSLLAQRMIERRLATSAAL